ncbi:MAG: PAS domain S-box protein [Candidatus Aquicultor sp.]|nr:PAS domain S-box protein [Candidatus Aquicultor sp.]
MNTQNNIPADPCPPVYRNHHFWAIVVTMLVAVASVYYAQLKLLLSLPGSSLLSQIIIERVLFVIPVAYALFVFELRGGLISLAVALTFMIPKAITNHATAEGQMVELSVMIFLGLVLLLFINYHVSYRRKQRLSVERLDVAHHKLRKKVRTSIDQESKLAALTSFSALLNQSLDMQEVIDTAIDMVKEIMRVEVVLLFSIDESAKELRIAAFEGVNQNYANAVDHMRLGDGFCGRVAQTGVPILIEDTRDDTVYSKAEAKEEGLRAQLSVPLRTRGKIIGTLCAATKSPRKFIQSEIELLSAIGNLIGIAMENSYLYKEHELSAEKLKLSEKRYRRLFENALDAIWVLDLAGTITAANGAAADLFGGRLEKLVGTNINALLAEEERSAADEIRNKLLQGEQLAQPYTQKIVKKDGCPAILKMTTNITSTNGKPDGLQFIARDITNEATMQENQQFYLEQVTQAHEEERLRISRDLHDGAAQNLIGILHQLENFCQTDDFLPMPRLRLLWGYHERLKDVLQEIRQLSRDLRPSILDDLGIIPAIDWLVEQVRTEHKLNASLTVEGERRRFLPQIEVTVFRIVQEALRNTSKHAEASNVTVSVEFRTNTTIISIEDDGKGFELPENTCGLSRLGKLGIDGMMTRARLVGGNLSITSKPDGGTSIVATIPHSGATAR